MILYVTGSPGKPPGDKHFMSCSPAGHLPNQYTLETDNGKWWDTTMIPPRPKNFDLIFEGGQCTVKDQGLADYLWKNGFASKQRPQHRYVFA
jgi:hypothetical protein